MGNGSLSAEWLDLGLGVLRKQRISEDRYQDRIRTRLLKSLVICYWQAIARETRRQGLTARNISEKLNVDYSTVTRWNSGKNSPEIENFLGILVFVLRKEIDEAGLPRNQDAEWEADCRTLSKIRVMECGRNRRLPTQEEIACVRYLMDHPLGGQLAPTNIPKDRSREGAVLVDIGQKMRADYPNGTIRTFDALVNAIEEWAEPYSLLCIGRPANWMPQQ